jgi:opacity protein-like surface antigen
MLRVVSAAAAVALAFAAAPLTGQEQLALELSGYAGRQSPKITAYAGSAPDYEKSWNFGAGVSLALSPNVAFRGEWAFSRNHATAPAIGPKDFNRMFGAGALEVRFPVRELFMPYALAGVGAVRVAEAGGTPRSIVTPAAFYGGGVAITVPAAPFYLFGQLSGWTYQLYGWPGIVGTQRDLVYSAGLRYRLPI